MMRTSWNLKLQWIVEILNYDENKSNFILLRELVDISNYNDKLKI